MRLPPNMTFRVVGMTFVDGYPGNLHALSQQWDEGYNQLLERGERMACVLQPNPDNAHDANAVEVHIPSIGMVGHMPAPLAAKWTRSLQEEPHLHQAWVEDVLIDPDHPDKPGISIRVLEVEQ